MPSKSNYGYEAGLLALCLYLAITWFYDLGINFVDWSPVNRAFWLGVLMYLVGAAMFLGAMKNKDDT